MKTLNMEIITPDKQAYQNQVNSVTAPASSGQIGILPGHMPLFTKLVEGEIKISKDNEEIYFAIGGGFLEVINDRVEILVTSAYHADELNEAELIEAQKRAKQALSEKPSGGALIEAQAQFRRSQIALKVLSRRRRHLPSGS